MAICHACRPRPHGSWSNRLATVLISGGQVEVVESLRITWGHLSTPSGCQCCAMVHAATDRLKRICSLGCCPDSYKQIDLGGRRSRQLAEAGKKDMESLFGCSGLAKSNTATCVLDMDMTRRLNISAYRIVLQYNISSCIYCAFASFGDDHTWDSVY